MKYIIYRESKPHNALISLFVHCYLHLPYPHLFIVTFIYLTRIISSGFGTDLKQILKKSFITTELF